MKTWNVYTLSKNGTHVKIMRVFANTESGAKKAARRQLNRPGRHSIYLQWLNSGNIVKEAS